MLSRAKIKYVAALAGVVLFMTAMAVVPGAWGQQAGDARAEFLKIEAFARLSPDQQATELPGFYRDVASRHVGELPRGLGGMPADILDHTSRMNPEGDPVERWSGQLAAGAGRMTPEQMADKLETPTWLNIASAVRTRAVLHAQRQALAPLVQADLDNTDPASFKRGCAVAVAAGLSQFFSKMAAVAEAKTALSPIADAALKQVGTATPDSTNPGPILAEVEKNPKALVHRADILRALLSNAQAPDLLVKLLDSPDKEIRFAAANALSQCRPDSLAKPIAKTARSPDPKMQLWAVQMAGRMSDSDFAGVHKDLAPLLTSHDQTLSLWAIQCFADHKDVMAGPQIEVMLKFDKADEATKDHAIQSLSALTGSTFDYDQFHWGAATNQKPIAQFETWLRQHGSP